MVTKLMIILILSAMLLIGSTVIADDSKNLIIIRTYYLNFGCKPMKILVIYDKGSDAICHVSENGKVLSFIPHISKIWPELELHYRNKMKGEGK